MPSVVASRPLRNYVHPIKEIFRRLLRKRKRRREYSSHSARMRQRFFNRRNIRKAPEINQELVFRRNYRSPRRDIPPY